MNYLSEHKITVKTSAELGTMLNVESVKKREKKKEILTCPKEPQGEGQEQKCNSTE